MNNMWTVVVVSNNPKKWAVVPSRKYAHLVDYIEYAFETGKEAFLKARELNKKHKGEMV